VVGIDNETPVVILGSAYGLADLGILRSLGRLGVPLYVVSSNPQELAFRSRYCSGKILSDICEFTEKSVLNLLNVGGKIGRRSILIPTTDQGVTFLANNAEALSEWFIFPHQTAELIHSASSKKGMYYLAKKYKIPTPEAVFPQSKQDVLESLETASFPIMLKEIHRWKSKEIDKVIVHSRRELVEKYDAMENPEHPNLMLQEYIPGRDENVWMFNGYFDRYSNCLFGITGRKIRMWPVHQGFTILGVCLKNETLVKTTIEFMKAIGYQGIVDVGYRFDARDRKYKVLDINPRIGSTFRLFVADEGMDVARALYLDMTGQSIGASVSDDGRKWLVEDLDLASFFLCFLDRSLSLKQWINSYRGVAEAAYFALDDPLPFLRMLEDHVKNRGHIVEVFRRLKSNNGRIEECIGARGID